MKQIIKCLRYSPFLLALCAMVFFGCRCSTTKPTPDPLAGWNLDFKEPNAAIVKDYEQYFAELPINERKFAVLGQYYRDGTGRHAIVIEIDLNGTDWAHVLFYDKENRRIKVVKYVSGHSRS